MRGWGEKPSIRLLKVQPRCRVADEADVVEAFFERKPPLKTLAGRFGVSEGVIIAILQRQGISERHGCFYGRPFHEKRVVDFNSALRRHLNVERAAAEVGCSTAAVRKSAARYGLSILRGLDARNEAKHAAIKDLARRDPDLSKTDIARKTGTSLETVSAVLGHAGRRNVFTAA